MSEDHLAGVKTQHSKRTKSGDRRGCSALFFGRPPRCSALGRLMLSERARPALGCGPQLHSGESAGSCWRLGPAALGLQAPRLPGQGLRRCFSNSDSSNKNSNQQVCGGVQGRLEVAASRSAASALILPPPPLPPGTFPGSNLTLGRGPPDCDPRNRWKRGCTRNLPETHTNQNGGAGPSGFGALGSASLRRRASGQSWFALERRRRDQPTDDASSGLPREIIEGSLVPAGFRVFLGVSQLVKETT